MQIQVRERQQRMLEAAAEGRRARRAAALDRAERRVDRAERQLARNWHEAARLREELAQLQLQPAP